MSFVRTGEQLLAVTNIARVDYSRVEELVVVVHCDDGSVHTITEGLAIDAVMLLSPGLLEGRRLRWAKHRWAVHNLIGHPVMQVLALCGRYEWAMRVHDATVPRPRGRR